MTAARYTVIRCDGDACDAEGSTPFPATAAEVRAWNGDWWTYRGRDLCPACRPPKRGTGPRLTARQAVVLQAGADGAPLRVIGARVGMSREQAGARLSEAYRALDVAWLPVGQRRSAAIRAARRHGLIDADAATQQAA